MKICIFFQYGYTEAFETKHEICKQLKALPLNTILQDVLSLTAN